jgi:predicted ribosomally synthesized peptide with SipW-like signal peptide
MKKILFGIMAIVLCIGLMGAAFASFSDTETSTGNTFTAGTLDLKIDSNPSSAITDWVDSPVPTIQSINTAVGNLKPGDSFSSNVGIKNFGTIAGTPSFKLTVTADLENGANEPEALIDNSQTGELSANVTLVLSYNGIHVATGTLAQFSGNTYVAPITLDGGVEGSWDYTVSIDSSVGNIIQSDSCTFDIVFGLAQ